MEVYFHPRAQDMDLTTQRAPPFTHHSYTMPKFIYLPHVKNGASSTVFVNY